MDGSTAMVRLTKAMTGRMRSVLCLLAVGLVPLTLATPAQAVIVYSNTFDGENGGASAQDYTGFGGLTVQFPSVDLVHTGDGNGITCAGGAGGCVDLDGGLSGKLESGLYSFNAGDTVTMSFSASGSQFAGSALDNTFYFFEFSQRTTGTFAFTSSSGVSFSGIINGGFGDFELNQNIGLAYDSGFVDYTLSFTPTMSGLFRMAFDDLTPHGLDAEFGNAFNNDGHGQILDNLMLDITPGGTVTVPEPDSRVLMLLAAVGLLAAPRRRAYRSTAA